jgi:2-keto-4-pentenoate hydratase/2-oxohepta-3-ene-1,7-dioic acid hydratase in catechol pathway
MKLATFSTDDNAARPGVIVGDEVADLGAVDGAPASILALLQQPEWSSDAESLVARAPRLPVSEVKLLAPVPNPPKYMAIGLNARDHRREVSVRWLMREPRLIGLGAGYFIAHPRSKFPYFFTKATSAITGPFDPIVLPEGTSKVDWEGELAVMIGARVHDVTPATAGRSIAGYLIANDVSVRDWQMDNPTATSLAKSYPSHGPLGPWMVTTDQLDAASLELRTYLNGELRQRGRIGDLIRSPAEIVSALSRFCVLEPGDIIACGTFAGIGWPVGRFLGAGDTVRVEVDGIGHIENPVVAYRRVEHVVTDERAARVGR